MTQVGIVKIGMIVISVALASQLARWQILEHTRWETEARLRHQLLLTEIPQRGEILANDGSKLAYNQKVYGIYIMPRYVKDVDSFSDRLAQITDIPVTAIIASLTDGRDYVALKHKVDAAETLAILTADCEVNSDKPCDLVELESPSLYAIRLEEESKRIYPEGQLAAHVIGYVGSDSEGIEAGKYGVEGYYDGELTGKYGVYMGTQDQSGHVIVDESLVTSESQQGITLELTIDRSIQRTAEKVAKQYVTEQNARSGTVVIMRPSTGEILGLANYPTFDPNLYWTGEILDCSLPRYQTRAECLTTLDPTLYPFLEEYRTSPSEELAFEADPDEEDTAYTPWKAYEDNSALVYSNLAVSDLYEPGSVMKILTVASGLDSGAIETDSKVADHPGCVLVIEGKKICTSNKRGASNQTIENVLKKSDNIGAYYIAKEVGAETLYDYFAGFGIGYEAKPGMEGEANNVLQLKAKGTWNELDLATAAFGQGIISVTPIQLVTAINTVANNGQRVQPHVVSSFIDGEKRTQVETKVLATPVSEQTAYETSELLMKALADQSWSFKLADVNRYYSIAGKTGTAQVAKETTAGYYSSRVITSFIGWVPAHDPQVIILVRLEEPQKDKSAYSSAVPMWNDVAREVVTTLSIPPDKLASTEDPIFANTSGSANTSAVLCQAPNNI